MIGKTVLHYKIIEELGRGGMGVVYLAEDAKLERKVAIKFLPRHIAGDSEQRERFRIEARSAAALNHPNIAHVYAIEEADDDMFMVMEYIAGKELREIIQHTLPQVLDLREVIDFAEQIARGLQVAHQKDIVHRDIKSANIMITDQNQAKVMDFGLAKVQGMQNITRIGTTMGTIAYMSPEQARGEEVDHRTDIWSFGVVLYEMLTGRLPFQAQYEQATIYGILNDQPQPISESVPHDVSSIEGPLFKCLEKNPQDRHQSMKEFLEDLNKFKSKESTGTSTAVNKVKLPSPVKYPIRKKMIYSVALSLSIFLCLILMWQSGFLQKWVQWGSLPEEQHVLVLPLTSIGDDPAQQIFCDGLAEILSSQLSQMESFHGSLWVVPFSEVRRQGIDSPGEARQSFGVNLAITGSLQLLNDITRLSLNLVNARSLRQLNSTVIDVKTSDVTTLQDQSVAKLFAMLKLELNPGMQEKLREGNTEDPVANEFYIRGRGYLQRYESAENLASAISLLNEAVKLDSRYALAYASLGEGYWRMYELSKDASLIEKASVNCRRAYELNDELAPVYITSGMISSGTGEYAEAVNNFSRALSINPTDADAYRGLAKAYEAQGLLNEAEITYQKAIELKPGNWAGYNALGVFYFRNNRYPEAEEQFKKVTALTPDNSRGYNNLGGVYYLMEKWEDARVMFERSLSLQKSYSVASNLGTLYFIEGRFADAARTYEMALEINEHDYLLWGNLASAYYWVPGKREKAMEVYRQAIDRAEESRKINPNDPQVLSSLAGYYAMFGERSKATDLITRSLEIAPRNSRIMFEAGTVFEQLDDRENALHWIGQALQNGHSQSEIEHQPELRELLADGRYRQIVRRLAENHKKEY